MQYIHSSTPSDGTRALADRILSLLNIGKKVLWLIPGGSSIPVATSVMKQIREGAFSEALNNLTVSLTDERYGPVGHVDSNWQHLVDSGFNFESINFFPVLTGLTLEETTQVWGRKIEAAFNDADIIVGQFGIGADGHIVGVLPHSDAVASTDAVFSYNVPPFTRITLTLWTLERVSVAYAFVFGAPNKREAIVNLRDKDLSYGDEPSQVLKKIPESYLYSDI